MKPSEKVGLDEVRECPACEASGVRAASQTQRFTYGVGKSAVDVEADVPVWTCRACGFEFTDGAAEEIRHDAVCRRLGRLTPRDIVEIRKRCGLSRSDVEELTGLGIASLQRWESGELIQNASSDRLMRILGGPNGVEMLRLVCGSAPLAERFADKTASRFRRQFTPEVVRQSQNFRLRLALEA